ncbi:MAG: PD-(D/E)XK nuclease family protein [Deltaproteobacteria bacterium]|nr:PD-(D/E)XK nuclease family protein [Deltaproteobacteria bacterium]
MGEPKIEISRLFAGPFPALEEKLLSRLPEEFGRVRGREDVLLVPSNDLREHLLRRLAAAWEGSAAGSSIMTLYDFAVRLLKHRGVFLRELPSAQASAAMLAAVREVYASGGGDFAGISETPGFVPALSRTMADIEEGWLGEEVFREAEARTRAGGREAKARRWSEWRRLYSAVEKKITAAGGMSRRRIFQEAVAGFEQPGYPFRVTIYGFYDFTRLQWTFVDALLASGLLDEVYFPGFFGEDGSLSPAFSYAAVAWERLLRAFEGNAEYLRDHASPAVGAVRERIFLPVPPAATGPVPFSLLSAPHERGEVRLAARKVREWLDAHPGSDILVVSRRFAEGLVPAWERVADEYGIRVAGRESVPLSSVPPVRLLIQMIEAAEEDFPRRTVIDVLSSPYRKREEPPPGVLPRPDLWDVWTKELMVVSGTDWETRLRGLRLREGGEETDDKREEHEERTLQLSLLREEVRALRETLSPVRQARSYAGLAVALRSLLMAGFRIGGGDGSEEERDRRAVSALFSLLDDVSLIPEREIPWPGTEAALAWFRALLADQQLFLGERGGMRVPGAVVAGDLFSLRGATADRILFLSVNEDAVPAQIEEDPLLPDVDREELNRLVRQARMPDALTLRRGNAAEERLLFSLPAASAREEVAFGVLRADAEGAAKRPSRYLLLLLAQFAGPGVFSEKWDKASGASVLSLSRNPFDAVSGPGPVSAREAALRTWRDGVLPDGESGDVPWHRVAATLSEWTARTEGRTLFPGPWTVIPPPAVQSSSALEELAKCPYRYFLHRLVRLAPAEEPEESPVLSPAEVGVLVHVILREVGKDAAAGKGWGDPPRAAAEAFDRFARENPVGLPGLFLLQRREVESAVGEYLTWEAGRASVPGACRVEAVEKSFEVRGDGDLPPFAGRVDRVDRGSSGEVEIIDYKYRDGKNERAPLSWIRNGLSHQIPVYLLFARSLSPVVRASHRFLKGDIRTVTVDGEQWDAIRGEWAASLAAWLTLLSAGYFPPLPHHRFRFAGDLPPRYCRGCPYRDHCRVSPAFEGTKWETEALVRRVLSDPALRAIAEFRPERGG